jgi:DNA adenine methylase
MNNAKPFLKWAGGKRQLLDELGKRFPPEIKGNGTYKFIEPFVGGGAVLFHAIQKYNFRECHIYDANEELILSYSVVKNNVEDLIKLLAVIESTYLQLSDESRKEFFYETRRKFNESKEAINFELYNIDWIPRAAQIIFLNRTCFNGLFRVNSKGEFNVPYGKYKNPKILDEANLRAVSILLQKVQIELGDFSECEHLVDEKTFLYFDPPYRPLSKTSSFTSYSKDTFDDESQKRLAAFYHSLHLKGAKLMLSNSDPKNECPNDHFFEEIYSQFIIERVSAKRNINAKGDKRGAINELIITNYHTEKFKDSILAP